MSKLSQLEFMKVGKNHSCISDRISEMDLMLEMNRTTEHDTEKLKHVKVVEVGVNTFRETWYENTRGGLSSIIIEKIIK